MTSPKEYRDYIEELFDGISDLLEQEQLDQLERLYPVPESLRQEATTESIVEVRKNTYQTLSDSQGLRAYEYTASFDKALYGWVLET